MPLVLTATDCDLWNCAGVDDGIEPAAALDAFSQLISITGTRSERGFHALPFAIQRTLAPLLPLLLEAPQRLKQRDESWLADFCRQVSTAMHTTRQVLLPNIDRLVNEDEFFDVYRICIRGFDGITFDGLAKDDQHRPIENGEEGPEDWRASKIVRLNGPSAGQTAIIMLIDEVLGVSHGEQTEEFRQKMRDFMPAKHAAFIRHVFHEVMISGSVKDAATKAGRSSVLGHAFTEAMDSLAAVRAFHLRMATSYLRRALKGTGDSDFRSMLDEGLRSTRKSGTLGELKR
ncbi:MAG: hypothetical protein SGPRY_003273 [Prymnesium sp.]